MCLQKISSSIELKTEADENVLVSYQTSCLRYVMCLVFYLIFGMSCDWYHILSLVCHLIGILSVSGMSCDWYPILSRVCHVISIPSCLGYIMSLVSYLVSGMSCAWYSILSLVCHVDGLVFSVDGRLR